MTDTRCRAVCLNRISMNRIAIVIASVALLISGINMLFDESARSWASRVFSSMQVQKVQKIPEPTEFTFMVVGAIDHGKVDNGKFFLGPLPQVGQSVNMVYVGTEKDTGYMRFQLRTDEQAHTNAGIAE